MPLRKPTLQDSLCRPSWQKTVRWYQPQQPSEGMQYPSSPEWKQNPLIVAASVSSLVRTEDVLAALLFFLWFVVLFIMKTNCPAVGGYWAKFADVGEDTPRLSRGCYNPCRSLRGLENCCRASSQLCSFGPFLTGNPWQCRVKVESTSRAGLHFCMEEAELHQCLSAAAAVTERSG